MVSSMNKAARLLLAAILAIALIPAPSLAVEPPSDGCEKNPDQTSFSLPSRIPTEWEMDQAYDNQLIVTYSDASPDLDQELRVASLDGSDLQDVSESRPCIDTTLADLGVVEADSLTEEGEGNLEEACDLLTFKEGTDVREAAAQLLSSPSVEGVQPNYRYELTGLGDTSYYDKSSKRGANHPSNDEYSLVKSSASLNQDYLYTTRIADAWDAGYKTNGKVTVAVVDSGPRLEHPDLEKAFDRENARDFTRISTGSGVRYASDGIDWSVADAAMSHGTNVSSILGATANNTEGIAGSSFNARILPIKVTHDGSLGSSTLIRAYSYLDSLVESGKVPSLKVINLSMGGTASDPGLAAAITHMASAHNVLTVASSGNEATNAHMYPADYGNVLSVMGVGPSFKRASFSNYGDEDVSAPATSITCAVPYSKKWNKKSSGRYKKKGMQGTSFSAPIVSGVAAMCYATKPGATAEEVRQAIKRSAVPISGIDPSCAPFLDALNALSLLVTGKGYVDARVPISSAKLASVSSAALKSGVSEDPKVQLRYNGTKLRKNVDYRISCCKNKKVGKAVATIIGIGRFKGTVNTKFKVVPAAIGLKGIKGSKAGFSARWASLGKKASGYQLRYSLKAKKIRSGALKKGRTLGIRGGSKSSAKVRGLKSGKRYYVQLRAYKKVSGAKYFGKWSKTKKVVAR